MNPQLSVRIMVCLSILYGCTIGVWSIVGAPDLGLVAIVGAIVLGAGWAIRGVLTSR
jgi:hypothetical protein